ncbi:MAG: nitronate monooxygenase [Ilumatobacteraceae bacterium]
MTPDELAARLTVPAIAAPMTGVSCPALTIAACHAGIVGSFPGHNAASPAQLGEWLDEIDEAVADAPGPGAAPAGEMNIARLTGGPLRPAPYAVNFPLRRPNPRLDNDVARVLESDAAMVIASVGSPRELVAPTHAAGKLLYADVASVRHATLAVEAGVDGLILLTAGAGGITGWANPFVFVRAVRAFYDGPIVMAGGIVDGRALWAALALGCDLAYLGTVLIPAAESAAPEDYKRAVMDAGMDDVKLQTTAHGLVASTIVRRDDSAGRMFSAGHSVHGALAAEPVADIVERFRRESAALPALALGRVLDPNGVS